MLTHFHLTQPKYLFYSNPEGGYIVVQGEHLQYRQFGHRVTHIFYVTETILGPCSFRIYMVCGVHLS